MALRFSNFELDSEAAELRCDGQRVDIEPQVFELVLFLAKNAGRIVSKDEIFETVWANRVVSDSAISTRINAARRALGDNGSAQKVIKTIHGRGFRFESSVRIEECRVEADRLHNFPISTTALIGREHEIGLVRSLILNPEVRLVTLTGVGGTGKTRLAQQVAAEVVCAFPDGVWFVDLAPIRDHKFVGSTIAEVLGVQEAPDRSAIESIKEYLRERRALLLLDNFEHILPAANMMTQLLNACENLMLMVTSRATLRLTGEYEVAVPPLTLPDLDSTLMSDADWQSASEAVQLFCSRARAVRPGVGLTATTQRTIAKICLQLDGLPLAIELAAARVRVLTPAEILSRLKQRLPLLTDGPRDLPARQQTLQDTISWSYDLLSSEEQQLFCQLSVFVGGFTSNAVNSILSQISDADCIDGLGSLLQQSLIQRQDVADGSRYLMLETLREFAAEKLAQSSDYNEIKRRHSNYYLEFVELKSAELRGPLQLERLAELTREHDNLRAALTSTLIDEIDVEVGARLAGALWWYWGVRGYLVEGRQWTDLALNAVGQIAPLEEARLLRATANFAFLQSDYDLAYLRAKDARSLFEQLDMFVETTWLTGLMAISLQYKGEVNRAREMLEDGLSIARGLADDWLVAWMLRNLGRIAHDHQQSGLSATYLKESLQLTRGIGDKRGIALSLHYLGVGVLDSEPKQAHDYLSECIHLFRQLSDRRGLAWALHYLAAAAVMLGDIAEAQSAEIESLSLRKNLGDRRGIAECLEGHAIRMTVEGHAEVAISLFATAATLRSSIGAPGSLSDQQRTKRHLDTAMSLVDESRADKAWHAGAAVPWAIAITELMELTAS